MAEINRHRSFERQSTSNSRDRYRASPSPPRVVDEYYVSPPRREQRRASTNRIHVPKSHSARQDAVRYQYEDRVPEAQTPHRRSSRRTPLFRVTSAPTTGAARGSSQHHHYEVRTRQPAPTEEDQIRARLLTLEEREREHSRNAQRRYKRYSEREALAPAAEREHKTEPGIEIDGEVDDDALSGSGFPIGSEQDNHEIPRIRVRRNSKNDAQEDAKTEARRDVRSSVQRASSNLKQFNDGDPRRYMEEKYGVLLETSEKTLDDVEAIMAFRSAIRKQPSALERLSLATKLETRFFSEPLTLSDSESDGASDEEVEQILNTVMDGDDLHIPDKPYKPRAEVSKDKGRSDAEDGDNERAQSLREREHSMREREVSMEAREASLRARMAAFEEREQRAQERDIARRQQERPPHRMASRHEPPGGYRQLPAPQHRHGRQPYYASDEGSDFDGSEIGDFNVTSRR